MHTDAKICSMYVCICYHVGDLFVYVIWVGGGGGVHKVYKREANPSCTPQMKLCISFQVS